MRRAKPEKRPTLADVRYNNVTIQTMIHHMFTRGKKSTATRVMYGAMDIIQERTGGKDPVEVFEGALRNVAPVMEVRPRRVGGATYQVPMEVAPARAVARRGDGNAACARGSARGGRCRRRSPRRRRRARGRAAGSWRCCRACSPRPR